MSRFILGAVVFCLLLSCGVAGEQGDSAGAPEPPTASDGTAAFLKDREKAQRAFWTKRMAEEAKWLAQTVALSPEQGAALARCADEAVKKAMEQWSAAVGQMAEDFRNDKDVADEPPLKVLMESWNSAVGNRVFGQYVTPAEQPAWREGLAGLLTQTQAETWKKQAPAHVAALQKPFLKQVKEAQDEFRETAAALLDQEIKNLTNAFELQDAPRKKLEALSNRLVNRRLAEWRPEAARCLADQPPEDPAGLPAEDFCVPEPRAVTMYDAGWIEGLGKILDARAWRSLASSLKARQARRPKVLAQMAVLAVDDEVRCTARQRERLLPLAERWVQAQPDLFQEQNRDGLTMANFLAAAARATGEELAGVLDESQIRIWRHVCIPGVPDEMGSLIPHPVRGLGQVEPLPGPLPVGARAETLLQAYLVRAEAKVRKRCLTRAVGCAQEIGRVCALPEETRLLLQTAARGAVEASLREWRTLAESATREQIEAIEDRNPETLRVQLEQMDSSGTLNEMETAPDKQPIWTRTLKKVMQSLPSPQAAAWREEEAARVAFKRQAIVRFVLEEFNQVTYLTPEQMPKLEALLEQALKSHAEELEQRSSGDDSPWFLSKPENLSPINYIPEAKLRPLLTAQQWTGWSKSEAFVETEGKK